MGNLYLVTRQDQHGYDEYDSFVVCTMTEEEARYTSPNDYSEWSLSQEAWVNKRTQKPDHILSSSWPVRPSRLLVTFLGTAHDSVALGSIVCSSFNAG